MGGRRLRRVAAILGTAAFLVLAPGTVVGLVPWCISRWQMHTPFFGSAVFRVLGVLLIAAGIPALLASFARFALQGIGTPAPVFPTKRLVVSGFYRYVRNPMYVAVVSIVLGQALLLGNVWVLAYGLCAWLVTHLFVLYYEEPTLRKNYGMEYLEFCAHVPRWLPRPVPWKPDMTRSRLRS
jgi:protein-S-isoprenylcysteine O-methyltransferase Ste14